MSVMGGGERVAIHGVKTALKIGHEVAFLSENFDVKRFEDFFDCSGLFDKVERITCPAFRPIAVRGFSLYQRLAYYQWKFRRLLSKQNRFGLVLSTQDVGYVPFVRAPVVQYCYFPEYFSHLESHPSSPLWRLYYFPARMFYRNRVHSVDKLLSTSNYTKRFVKQAWGRQSMTLYPPCPIELYSSQRSQRDDVAITVGRIVPEKRMNLFTEMARKLPQIKFVIVGSVAEQRKTYYDWLRSNAPENISFILSPLRKVKDILARAKVYVHCAENEHFGITIVEAMASGCVPVVHDSGGPQEIVTQDVGYRWRSVGEAVAQISELMKDNKLRQYLSSAASARAQLFSTEAFESGLSNVLNAYGQ